MHSKNEYVAVFDSGVGGISVLRELKKRMPEERYLYFGDSANAPYGDKTTDEVRELTLRAVENILPKGVKALVVACNTATAAAIGALRQAHPDLIVIGIEPALKMAADRFPTGQIGVMATQVTLREDKFHQQLERFPDAQVYPIAAPGLVELIESGYTEGMQVEQLLREVLTPYVGKLDALVLGCTHYPFVRAAIRRIMGESTLLFDGGEGTARQTKRCLAAAGLLHEGRGVVRIENSSADPAPSILSRELLYRRM